MVNKYSEIRSRIDCDLSHHSSLRTVETYLRNEGHDPDTFFFFTTVRNPWDRAVSIFHYGLKNPKSVWHKPAAAATDFVDFLDAEILDRHFRPTETHTPLAQGPYVIDQFMRDNAGRIRGEVFRMEDLGQLQTTLKSKTGIDAVLPHVNATDRDHYHKYYNDAAREWVAYLFEKDIARFGYTF